jgi:hypothetical protein
MEGSNTSSAEHSGSAATVLIKVFLRAVPDTTTERQCNRTSSLITAPDTKIMSIFFGS